jgi:hypothetical protein
MTRRYSDVELAEMRRNAKHWRDRSLSTQGIDPDGSGRAWRTAEGIEADIRTEMSLRAAENR